MATTIKKICPVCETEYEALLSEVNRGGAKTCSRSCGVKHHRAKEMERPGLTLLPRCGVTDSQVREAITSAPNIRAAAKQLGVAEDHLRRVARQHGIKANRRRPRRRCVTAEDIASLAKEGYTRPDVAFLLGISPAYLKDLISLWGLADTFVVTRGRAAAVTRNGYAWAATHNQKNDGRIVGGASI